MLKSLMLQMQFKTGNEKYVQMIQNRGK